MNAPSVAVNASATAAGIDTSNRFIVFSPLRTQEILQRARVAAWLTGGALRSMLPGDETDRFPRDLGVLHARCGHRHDAGSGAGPPVATVRRNSKCHAVRK